MGNDKKNRVFNFAPSYSAGPLFVGYTHLRDKDITTAGITTGVFGGINAIVGPALLDVRSDRLSAAYTLPMGFKIGLIYDRSKVKAEIAGGIGVTDSLTFENQSNIGAKVGRDS